MSKRKREAIAAAKGQAKAEADEKPVFWQRLKSPKILAAMGIGLLITFGVIGATVSDKQGKSLLGLLTNATSSASQPAATNPLPSATPQLSKEYLYAGSRLLAVEDANASASSNQPTDLVVWRLVGGSGNWYIRDSNNGTISSAVWGSTGDVPIPADFDGDGLYDFCVFRPNAPSAGLGSWYIQPNNNSTYYGAQFGLSTDKPVPADYDGDGRADIAVWRDTTTSGNPSIPPSFFILRSSTNTVEIVNIGQTGDTAIPADYDGDGRADVAVYHLASSTTNYYDWTIRRSSDGQTETISYGDAPNGDKPVTGDFDGDGKFDIATRRDGTNQWLVRNVTAYSMNISGFAMQAADRTVAGDYDGDGKTDPAVWRPSNGTWYIRQSSKSGSGQMRVEQWGISTDTPVPAPFHR